MPKKDNLIVLWRILFTYTIVFFHFGCAFPILRNLGLDNGLYIATDFFFLVSGYLLYSGFVTNPERYRSGGQYTLDRIKKILPVYMISYALIIIFRMITLGIKETLYYISFHFMEILMLQGIGTNEGLENLNNSTWFVSVMLIAGFIIYTCLKKWHDKFVEIIAPLCIIICLSAIYRNVGSLKLETNTNGLFLNYMLFRGFMEMCMGIYAYKMNVWIVSRGKHLWLYKVLGSLGFVFVICASAVYGWSKRDFIYLAILFVSVSFSFIPTDSRLVKSAFIHRWSSLTMNIYLIHMFVVDYIFPYTFRNCPSSIPFRCMLAVAAFVAATLLALVIDLVLKRIRKSR